MHVYERQIPDPCELSIRQIPGGVRGGGGWLLQEWTHALYRCEPKASVIDECHCTIHASRKYVILAIEPRFCNCDVRLSDILFRRVYYLMILNEFWEYISNGYSLLVFIFISYNSSSSSEVLILPF